MSQTRLPTTWKAQKWEKRSFQLLGKPENEKNEASNYLECSKMKKTELPTTRKAQKWEKRSFRLLGKLKKGKNGASDYSESSKMRKTELPRPRKVENFIQQPSQSPNLGGVSSQKLEMINCQ